MMIGNMNKALWLFVALSAPRAPSVALAQVNHPDLPQQADAVVVGKIAQDQQNGATVGLMLLVDRVLKGSFAAGQTLNIMWGGAPPSRAPGQPWGDYGIWFLQSVGSRNYQIVPVPASRRGLQDSCYRLPEGVPPPSTTTAGATAPSPGDLVLAELTNAAETFDAHTSEFFLTAGAFFRMPPSPSLMGAYRQMSQSSNIQVKVLGLIGLLQQGDATALDQLPKDVQTLSSLALRGQVTGAISMVRDPSPVTVAALGSLATQSPGLGIQYSAAEALSKIHTKESLPYFALLLDSQDMKLRNWAFEGFSRFVMNLPVETPEMVTTMAWTKPQGPQPYRTTETDRHTGGFGTPEAKQAEYVSFWKAWWSQMQDKIK